MSRLSLKPGGEPGTWIISYALEGSESSVPHWFDLYSVPDTDLIAIQRTITEYFAAKEPQSGQMANAYEKPKHTAISWWWLALAAACGLIGAWIGISHMPAPIAASTGGVIDQLCMRPEIECSTEIRYLHPLPTDKYHEEIWSTKDHPFYQFITVPEAR